MLNLFSFQEANDHLSAPNCSFPVSIVWQIEFEQIFCTMVLMFKGVGCPFKLKTKMLAWCKVDYVANIQSIVYAWCKVSRPHKCLIFSGYWEPLGCGCLLGRRETFTFLQIVVAAFCYGTISESQREEDYF